MTGPSRDVTDAGPREHTTVVLAKRGSWLGRVAAILVAVVALAVLALVLAAVHLLPQLRNPFAETTTDRSQPVVLKSISQLSRYEAASGSFEVVVDLQSHSFLPSFIEGNDTLFVGQGSDIAYVDFSQLKGQAISVSANRTAVTVKLPKAQLEPAVLNVHQSYVYAQQEGLANRIGNFFSGNPNNEQKVYEAAQTKIQNAAQSSQLVPDAQKNTQAMLTSMLKSLGFQQVTVTFGS
ncbi:MAG: DUF4230 domain-containing protein [Actinobacteria bacterium]|nr:DUF4230 domain-containing protein [Actinomycetota bacterium]